MDSAFTTCTETSGSGARTGTIRKATRPEGKPTRPDPPRERPGCSAAAAGRADRVAGGPPPGSDATPWPTGVATRASGWPYPTARHKSAGIGDSSSVAAAGAIANSWQSIARFRRAFPEGFLPVRRYLSGIAGVRVIASGKDAKPAGSAAPRGCSDAKRGTGIEVPANDAKVHDIKGTAGMTGTTRRVGQNDSRK